METPESSTPIVDNIIWIYLVPTTGGESLSAPRPVCAVSRVAVVVRAVGEMPRPASA